MISSFSCTHARRDNASKFSCGTFCDGMLQFYLFPVIFGWVWSIVVGYQLYQKGRDYNKLKSLNSTAK